MQTTTNIDKTARTARQMAEVQRDSYEALAQNFASAQRRSVGLAEGGLEFMRLQEQNAKGCPGVVRQWHEADPAPAEERRVRAGLDG